ncbi:unnamed protein product [Symbiodinium natans]|uniref:Uncharacterized protein n=1 Tax=Symbiodinium natans TaxID=878477 RepID=A0A812SVW7_9DINO|nr:unnamed protein product [Symbiodinium natans]
MMGLHILLRSARRPQQRLRLRSKWCSHLLKRLSFENGAAEDMPRQLMLQEPPDESWIDAMERREAKEKEAMAMEKACNGNGFDCCNAVATHGQHRKSENLEPSGRTLYFQFFLRKYFLMSTLFAPGKRTRRCSAKGAQACSQSKAEFWQALRVKLLGDVARSCVQPKLHRVRRRHRICHQALKHVAGELGMATKAGAVTEQGACLHHLAPMRLCRQSVVIFGGLHAVSCGSARCRILDIHAQHSNT